MSIMNNMVKMGLFETVLVMVAVVLVLNYIFRVGMAAYMACTIQTDSKGMKHLKHQKYNKFYAW